MGAVEFRCVGEVAHQTVQTLLRQHVGVEHPVGIDTLSGRERLIVILVVEEAVFLAPHVLVDIGRHALDVVLELLYLLPALQIEAHLQQLVGYHDLLQAGIEPYHVAVAVDGIILFLYTRHIVHACSPAARPIHAVAPGMVELQPLVIGCQHREYLVQAVVVAELRVVEPFRPRQDVRTRRCWVVAAEAVGAVGTYLTADEAVGMLLGIEVVEGLLEGEEGLAIAAEHRDEGTVPHEDVSVVGR